MADAQQPSLTPHTHDEDKADEAEPDVHFEPVVKLEKVEITDSEADETPIFKMRAKLFRFDKAATEWKERGTGEMKLLMHKKTGKVRVLMRREKTLKLCANHYITPEMKLNPNVGSDRSWVWTALADYSEEEVKPEMLAARFATSDIAKRFRTKFEEAQKWNQALNSGAATPNSKDAPQPDPDAVEVPAEEGSDKKHKEEAAAVAAAVPEDRSKFVSTTSPAPELSEVKLNQSATDVKPVEPTSAVESTSESVVSKEISPEAASHGSTTNVSGSVHSKEESKVVDATLESVTNALADTKVEEPTTEKSEETHGEESH